MIEFDPYEDTYVAPRKPTRWERLMFKLFSRWPESYVQARMYAVYESEANIREAIRRYREQKA